MHWPAHSRQKSSVALSIVSASGALGASRCEACQVRAKAIRSPAVTVKSAYVVRSRPYVSASPSSQTESGPATATVRWPPSGCSTRCTQGTTRP